MLLFTSFCPTHVCTTPSAKFVSYPVHFNSSRTFILFILEVTFEFKVIEFKDQLENEQNEGARGVEMDGRGVLDLQVGMYLLAGRIPAKATKHLKQT